MRSSPLPDLVTVYVGPHARVAVLEGLLAAVGIPSFVPDRMLKTIDPFITGANPLDLRLQVPTQFVARTLTLLATDETVTRDEAERDPEAARSLEVTRLGRRIRFAALFGFTSPFALAYARRYLREARALPEPPAMHFWTLAAIPLAVVTACTALILVFWI